MHLGIGEQTDRCCSSLILSCRGVHESNQAARCMIANWIHICWCEYMMWSSIAWLTEHRLYASSLLDASMTLTCRSLVVQGSIPGYHHHIRLHYLSLGADEPLDDALDSFANRRGQSRMRSLHTAFSCQSSMRNLQTAFSCCMMLWHPTLSCVRYSFLLLLFHCCNP